MLIEPLRRAALFALLVLLITQNAAAITVLLDVGHDPRRAGAIGASGTTEHHWNLTLAAELSLALKEADIVVDMFIAKPGLSIKSRVHSLGNLEGDVLLSIHHDSVQEFDRADTQAFGARTRYTAAAEGFSLFVSSQDPGYTQAVEYARAIGNAMTARGLTPNLYHARDIEGERRPLIDPLIGLYRFDRLAVLRGVSIPGVLIEAGVIANPLDEARAGDATHRALIVEAIVEALSSFK